MNVLEESQKNPTVTALVTVFKKFMPKKGVTWQAATQKVTANLFTLQD